MVASVASATPITTAVDVAIIIGVASAIAIAVAMAIVVAIELVKRGSMRCRSHIELGQVPQVSEERLAELDVQMAAYRLDCKRRGVQPGVGLPVKR